MDQRNVKFWRKVHREGWASKNELFPLSLARTKIAPVALDYQSARTRLAAR